MSHVKQLTESQAREARQKAREEFEKTLRAAYPDPEASRRRAAAAMFDVWWEGTDPWEPEKPASCGASDPTGRLTCTRPQGHERGHADASVVGALWYTEDDDER